jgi:hypothetical protein
MTKWRQGGGGRENKNANVPVSDRPAKDPERVPFRTDFERESLGRVYLHG